MKNFIGGNKSDDLFLIQIRLFRLAQNRWNLDGQKCIRQFYKVKNGTNAV